MKHKITSQDEFATKILSLWPALKGSLALVRKPCIRPHCPACASGDKHPAYLLAFTEKGSRRCMYVPQELVPMMKKAVKNGRQVERLLYKMGPALIQKHREDKASNEKEAKNLRNTNKSNSKASKRKTKC